MPLKVGIGEESFYVLPPPDVDTALYGKKEKEAVVAALRKRLNHKQKLRVALGQLDSQVGGKDRFQPLSEFF